MASGEARPVRSLADVERAVRSLARHFQTDTVVLIGSQAVLLEWPDAPALVRTSPEIDAFPANNRVWEAAHPGQEASEEINALFGFGSAFHAEFGFFIDGVDETTAKLPPGWRDRSVVREWHVDGHLMWAIAPRLDDLVVSKLHRLDEKDKAFIRACHEGRPLDLPAIKRAMHATLPPAETESAAAAFLETLL